MTLELHYIVSLWIASCALFFAVGIWFGAWLTRREFNRALRELRELHL